MSLFEVKSMSSYSEEYYGVITINRKAAKSFLKKYKNNPCKYGRGKFMETFVDFVENLASNAKGNPPDTEYEIDKNTAQFIEFINEAML